MSGLINASVRDAFDELRFALATMWRQCDNYEWFTGYLRRLGAFPVVAVVMVVGNVLVALIPLTWILSGTNESRLLFASLMILGVGIGVRSVPLWPNRTISLVELAMLDVALALIVWCAPDDFELMPALLFTVIGVQSAIRHGLRVLVAHNGAMLGFLAIMVIMGRGGATSNADSWIAAVGQILVIAAMSSVVPIATIAMTDIWRADVDRRSVDGLTGLLNRAGLSRRLRQWCEGPEATVASMTVAIIDLDHFKRINDEFGHRAGDTVLVALAARLRHAFSSDTVVARFGGEEFVVCAPGGHDPASVVGPVVRAVALAGQDVRLALTTSVGVVRVASGELAILCPEAMRRVPEALLAEADDALYAAKRAGGDCTVFREGQDVLLRAVRSRIHADDALRPEPLSITRRSGKFRRPNRFEFLSSHIGAHFDTGRSVLPLIRSLIVIAVALLALGFGAISSATDLWPVRVITLVVIGLLSIVGIGAMWHDWASQRQARIDGALVSVAVVIFALVAPAPVITLSVGGLAGAFVAFWHRRGDLLLWLTCEALVVVVVAVVTRAGIEIVIPLVNLIGVTLLIVGWFMPAERDAELAEEDSLTETLNLHGLRRAVRSLHLTQLWAGSPDRELAVLVIDVDKFKQVNDEYGHLHGDRVLIDIARAVRSTIDRIGAFGLLGRVGGDEFVVVSNLRGCDCYTVRHLSRMARMSVNTVVSEHAGDVIDLTMLAESIRVAVATLSGPTVSVGVTTTLTPSVHTRETQIGLDVELLRALARADRAMYKAKACGGNRYEIVSRSESKNVATSL